MKVITIMNGNKERGGGRERSEDTREECSKKNTKEIYISRPGGKLEPK